MRRVPVEQDRHFHDRTIVPARSGAHGQRFYYASPNTDMLGMVIERVAGVRYADYLADRLWKPMGATGQAFVTVDRVGTARAVGDVCVMVTHSARLGQLVLDGDVAQSGKRVIPADWIADMHQNGNLMRGRPGISLIRSRTAATGPVGTRSATASARSPQSAPSINGFGSTRSAASYWSNSRPGQNPATMPRRRSRSKCSARSQEPCDSRRSRRQPLNPTRYRAGLVVTKTKLLPAARTNI